MEELIEFISHKNGVHLIGMIPVHDFSLHNARAVKVIQLNELTNYDFGQPHRHNYFEFFIFLKGGGIHQIDFRDYKIETGSVHIVAPGQIHLVKRELDSNGFVILFETNVFEANQLVTNFLFDHICLDMEEFSPVYHFSESIQTEIQRTIQLIWEDFNSGATLKNEFVLSNMVTLFIQCIRSRQSVIPTESDKNQTLYIKFRRLLKNNFTKIKKVKEYASVLGVSEKQLNEIVQHRIGMPVSSLIYSQLILEARRLLRTGISSKEVAFELNFDDPAHFSKFFKSQTGISPGDFQKIQD